jgi:hypothetical protein
MPAVNKGLNEKHNQTLEVLRLRFEQGTNPMQVKRVSDELTCSGFISDNP